MYMPSYTGEPKRDIEDKVELSSEIIVIIYRPLGNTPADLAFTLTHSFAENI